MAGRYEYEGEELRDGRQLEAITSVAVTGRIGPGGVAGVLVTSERPVS